MLKIKAWGASLRLGSNVIFFILPIILTVPVHGNEVQNQASYVTSLIEKAGTLKLDRQREWLVLGHWRKIRGGAFRSEIDDVSHFLSPQGQSDPQAELIATIKAFSAPITGPEKEHAHCRYPSRKTFLYRRLNIDVLQMPQHPCASQKAWKAKLNADSVSVIFASAYLNNAASMFGHTFLKFHSRENSGDRDLLNYGVNFAANTGSDGGLPFAFYGLVGSYKGTFSLLPFHQTLKTYASLEGRDIWEYKLNFSTEEVERIVDHLLELEPTFFWYYFLSANCSYQILALFEAARPSLQLTDHFFYWVIPADTVRVFSRVPGLVAETRYRASLETELKEARANLSSKEDAIAWSLLKIPKAGESALNELDQEQKTRILDAALRYGSILEYSEPDRWQQREYELKTQRAQLGVISPPSLVKKFPARPEEGHESSRVGLGYGNIDQKYYSELTARAAYHNLLSDDTGFLPNTHLEILRFKFRRENEAARFFIQEFYPLDLFSATPADRFFQPISWKVDVGFTRLADQPSSQGLALTTNPGLGYTLSLFGSRSLHWFNLINVHADVGEDLQHQYRLGVGGMSQLLVRPSRWYRLLAGAEYRHYEWGQKAKFPSFWVDQSISLSRNLELRLDWRQNDRRVHQQAQIFWHLLL